MQKDTKIQVADAKSYCLFCFLFALSFLIEATRWAVMSPLGETTAAGRRKGEEEEVVVVVRKRACADERGLSAGGGLPGWWWCCCCRGWCCCCFSSCWWWCCCCFAGVDWGSTLDGRRSTAKKQNNKHTLPNTKYQIIKNKIERKATHGSCHHLHILPNN